VTGRHVVLPIGAVLVLGLGVYLFVEVRAEPVPPQIAAPPRPSRPTAPQAEPEIAHGDEPATAPPRSSDRPVRAPRPAAAGPPSHGPEGGAAPALDAGPGVEGPKLDAVMAEANKAYDRGDFEEAKTIAGRLLATQPANVRMLRIMVSASCIDGDTAVAQASFVKLPPADQEQMRVRCTRYGITLTDKP
jgi:hypothetical protein